MAFELFELKAKNKPKIGDIVCGHKIVEITNKVRKNNRGYCEKIYGFECPYCKNISYTTYHTNHFHKRCSKCRSEGTALKLEPNKRKVDLPRNVHYKIDGSRVTYYICVIYKGKRYASKFTHIPPTKEDVIKFKKSIGIKLK